MQKLSLKTLLVKLAFITIFLLSPNYGQESGSVYGFVKDSSNGEALIGANVFINDLSLGMATDINGYYVLQEIIPGTYDISVSYVGYKVLNKKIDITSGSALKLDLIICFHVKSFPPSSIVLSIDFSLVKE